MFFPRAIIHLDADAFFASVEQSADPRLRGKPIAVGGEKRGIIASASYEARKFGIYTPMPRAMARRLCARSSSCCPVISKNMSSFPGSCFPMHTILRRTWRSARLMRAILI